VGGYGTASLPWATLVGVSAYDEYIYDRVVAAIDRVPVAERAETYVISLWVTDESDDERIPAERVGHNTETAVTEAIPTASSELEARWNFAFYLQDELALIGAEDGDPGELALRDAWITEQTQLNHSSIEAFVIDGTELTNPFIHLLIRVVQRLHENKAITAVFGRAIPVLIHELEYYDEILDQKLRANPTETTAGLQAWFDAGLT